MRLLLRSDTLNRGVSTRERILENALACFAEEGYERTTVARIRERSGVSNGALFHHFATKEAIAGALYVESIRSLQEGHRMLLAERPASVADAIGAAVTHQLSWTEANPERAKFLYGQGHLDWSTPAGAELSRMNRELAYAYREWMRPFVERGELREISTVMLTAIVTGPAHAIAQRWLAGQLPGQLTSYADELAEAAVAALTGRPAGAGRMRLPHRGRVSLQLLDDDGAVLGDSQAVLDINLHGT
jgi:AcrR family transcriptional regulator